MHLCRANPMSSVTEIYNTLFAGKKLEIRLANKREYESLRVALHKAHQTPRLILEITDDSLCASFDATQGVGTFWLGAPRQAMKKASFEILKESEIDNGAT